MKAVFRLLWRLLPLCLVVWAMRGGVTEYVKYGVMAKEASRYTVTYFNMSNYVTALEHHTQEYGSLPQDLAGFLRRRFESKKHDPSLDAWDTPYQIMDGEPQFALLSCGPDHACETSDDVTASGVKAHTRDRGNE